VETFVTDLAGYYHSLLLLKAGITREAVLGYPPARFSKAALEKYDAIRPERAGELLYDLHRNIRYSVSPRFELETLASKLCWLEKWISPPELGDAVAQARKTLGGASPLATGAPAGSLDDSEGAPGNRNPLNETETLHGNVSSPAAQPSASGSGQAGSLSEEFKRYMAAKANTRQTPEGRTPGTPASFGTPTDRSEAKGGSPLDARVQRVVSVFNGTIVEESRE
jgi:DNA polymerase-3 subunit gamma/tau